MEMGLVMIGRRGAVTGAGAAALAGCAQQPATLPANTTPRLGPNRTGYLIIDAPIVSRVRDLFIGHVDRLLQQDAAEVYVLISSPGGSVGAAQDMINYVDRTHAARGVKFTMHNTRLVASAACYVFLAAQRRLSVPGSAFLFHEASLVSSGPLTSQNLQEAGAVVQEIERGFTNMLTSKTRLTAAEAGSFIRRTVILSADEARRDGVVEAVSGFALPSGATIYQIKASTTPGAAASPARPASGG